MPTTEERIKITLNGAAIEIPGEQTLGHLLDDRKLDRRMIAVEYNGEILPRRYFDETIVAAGDVLEIVQMVGGG